MPLELWLAFAAASAVMLVIPGPTILTVISYSMAHGRRANVPLVAGMLVAMRLANALAARFPMRSLATIGFLLMAAGLAWGATTGVSDGFARTAGWSTILAKRPVPSASSTIVPTGSSRYASTTTPASAQRCRYQSL